MKHSTNLGIVLLLATALGLASCGSSGDDGGSTGGSGSGGGGTPPAGLRVDDRLAFVYTDGSGRLDALVTFTFGGGVQTSGQLNYELKDGSSVSQDVGGANWSWSASASTSSLLTEYTSFLDPTDTGTNTWTMTWTSATEGTARDTGGDTTNFVYTPAP